LLEPIPPSYLFNLRTATIKKIASAVNKHAYNFTVESGKSGANFPYDESITL